MDIPLASLMGMLFAASEIGLALFKRADAAVAQAADRGSLRLLWMVIVVSITAGFWVRALEPQLAMPPQAATDLGIAAFALGLMLRWYAIVYLGRLFTVNVAIARDHPLVDKGPYRWIRHPSYAGALLAFAGLGSCLANWASLAIILTPTFAAFLRRIAVEETALANALGERYRAYQRRTRRLIPWVF